MSSKIFFSKGERKRQTSGRAGKQFKNSFNAKLNTRVTTFLLPIIVARQDVIIHHLQISFILFVRYLLQSGYANLNTHTMANGSWRTGLDDYYQLQDEMQLISSSSHRKIVSNGRS